MQKYLHNTLKLLLVAVLVVLLYVSGVLIINSAVNYKPATKNLDITGPEKTSYISGHNTFSILSWNIGYAGLGSKSDFFYDGGKMVRPAREDYELYKKGILECIQAFDSLDFILLQEIDTASTRSYGINQYAEISGCTPAHSNVFAKNYDVAYVPVPVFRPMAKVISGLAVFSRFSISSAMQVVFPENYAWPKSLFMPDRCFILTIFDLPSGRKLHIINTHNSAFDDGSLRISQLRLLHEYMQSAYQKGDYVVAGGDWNLNPEGYGNTFFVSGDIALSVPGMLPASPPASTWAIAFDPDYPTNRDVSAPYAPGLTPTTIIDYFMCSPNIKVLDVRTLYDGFKNSDHQPVYLRFELL